MWKKREEGFTSERVVQSSMAGYPSLGETGNHMMASSNVTAGGMSGRRRYLSYIFVPDRDRGHVRSGGGEGENYISGALLLGAIAASTATESKVDGGGENSFAIVISVASRLSRSDCFVAPP